MLGLLFDLGAYPGLVLDSDASELVEGEIWEALFRPRGLRAIDAYEGFFPERPEDSLFVRVKARIHLRHGTTLAWVYVVRKRTRSANVIASGKWRRSVATCASRSVMPRATRAGHPA